MKPHLQKAMRNSENTISDGGLTDLNWKKRMQEND